MRDKISSDYTGFEQGPIRPPSEARSLLIRITRNCPWNWCTFCPVYKEKKFSRRQQKHVLQDIDLVHKFVDRMIQAAGGPAAIDKKITHQVSQGVEAGEEKAFFAAVNWVRGGMESVFLQDANSLVIRPEELAEILRHITDCFPWVKRITSYARARTISGMESRDMALLALAGLNRIHIGMESGSDEVLKLIKKGVTKEQQVAAGLMVRNAGIELSEYVMPGLGGKELSRVHALETADAISTIDPQFIRIRPLALPEKAPLYDAWADKKFQKLSELETLAETALFLQHLKGITSYVASDHILNLFQDLEGRMPDDRDSMLDMIKTFAGLPDTTRALYQIGRRAGIFNGLKDMKDPEKLGEAKEVYIRLKANPGNVEKITAQLTRQFI